MRRVRTLRERERTWPRDGVLTSPCPRAGREEPQGLLVLALAVGLLHAPFAEQLEWDSVARVLLRDRVWRRTSNAEADSSPTSSRAGSAGHRDRAPHRPDTDAGRDRHAGHARARGDGARSRAHRGVGAVRRSQPAAGGLQERRRPPVPAQRLPALRHLVQPGRATASAIRCTWSASASRARRCSARTATPARRARSACWPSAPAASRWRWRWRASRFTARCRRSGACGSTGELPDWVSAKDVILEMLRRHGVRAALGRIIEYYGPGLARLSAMDRHVIANMGAELGATTTVFPSDEQVRRFLRAQGREDDFVELLGRRRRDVRPPRGDRSVDARAARSRCRRAPATSCRCARSPGARSIRPTSARRRTRAIATSPSPRQIVKGRHVHDRVSFDVNPTSRQILENLVADGHVGSLLARRRAPAPGRLQRLHRHGPGAGDRRISLRTVPRNFPGPLGHRARTRCVWSAPRRRPHRRSPA